MFKRLLLWGRPYKLSIDFEGEKPSKQQEKVLTHFLENTKAADAILPALVEYLRERQEILKDFDVDPSLIDEEVTEKNLPQFFTPESIYIPENDRFGEIAILGESILDQESGAALIFFADGKTAVGPQSDII